ncbi:MAG: hypothetical protein HOB32_08025 [Nitrospina sp.]|nr:hypothetical protein [Nitrospina sp.]
MSYIKTVLLVVFFIFVSLNESFSSTSNKFNQLILAKSSLEFKFGVRSVECFPFNENIGFTEDQIPLIERCLQGIKIFESALIKVGKVQIHSVGISTRFLRTGGFNTILIPWDASLEEIGSFLEGLPSKSEQDHFLEKISALKHKINRKFRIFSLYCSQRISNKQCMSGYKRLALIDILGEAESIKWQEVILDDRQGLGKDSHSFRIKYDTPLEEMRKALHQDPQQVWLPRKNMYESIKSKYKQAYEKRLQIASYFCSVELTEKNCLDGLSSLGEASKNQDMRMKPWGEVSIEKYNTFIKDDFDVSIRYDLPVNKLVDYFSSKTNRVEATENAVLAEKLQKRTLNNSSGLRAVCDLEGMRSRLCVKAFKDFISFVSSHRDYRAKDPWTNIMFVDGTQINRINFALNSSARHSYIYIDAGSGLEELKSHLMRFGN